MKEILGGLQEVGGMAEAHPEKATGSSGLNLSHMKYIWSVVFFIVAVFGFGITEWDAIGQLIESKGVGDEQVNLLAFVAGYALPLTAGVAVIMLLALRGAFNGASANAMVLSAGVILWLSGLAASYLGLGLLPNYDLAQAGSGPLPGRLLVWSLTAYFNTYGWPLVISAIAIGCGVGMHIEAYLRDHGLVGSTSSSPAGHAGAPTTEPPDQSDVV
jgi:hypothetical protein